MMCVFGRPKIDRGKSMTRDRAVHIFRQHMSVLVMVYRRRVIRYSQYICPPIIIATFELYEVVMNAVLITSS